MGSRLSPLLVNFGPGVSLKAKKWKILFNTHRDSAEIFAGWQRGACCRPSPPLVYFGPGVSPDARKWKIDNALEVVSQVWQLARQSQGTCDKLATTAGDGDQHVGIDTSPDNWRTCYYNNYYYYSLIIITVVICFLSCCNKLRHLSVEMKVGLHCLLPSWSLFPGSGAAWSQRTGWESTSLEIDVFV